MLSNFCKSCVAFSKLALLKVNFRSTRPFKLAEIKYHCNNINTTFFINFFLCISGLTLP